MTTLHDDAILELPAPGRTGARGKERGREWTFAPRQRRLPRLLNTSGLDLTSGPPLDAPASHSHPTPPSMDTDSCTAPCLNARGVWILTRQGTGSRGTTAPAAPRRWVHRSRRGPPSKTGAPAARVLCAPAWPPSCRCESRIPPQQPYSQVADCQLSRPHHPSRRWRRRAR